MTATKSESFVNPDRQPPGRGCWDFYSDDDRQQAQECFANQTGFGTDGINDPTAEDIWNVRQNFRGLIASRRIGKELDVSQMVNLVWIPNGHDEDAQSVSSEEDNDLSNTGADYNDDEEDATTSKEVDMGYGIDKHTGLAHNPSNDGVNDQTALPGQGKYQTRILGGTRVTIDRARAQPGPKPQTAKTWACNKSGLWVQYSKTNTINWEDKPSVEKLNKWKEQFCKRTGWTEKRKANRPSYTQQERDWVFDRIVASGGKKPTKGKASEVQFAKDFNERFPIDPPRELSGICGLVDRLMKEYKQYGGKMRPRQAPDIPEEASPYSSNKADPPVQRGKRVANSSDMEQEDEDEDDDDGWNSEDGEEGESGDDDVN